MKEVIILDEKSNLAAIGMDEYKGEIEFVNGWLLEKKEAIGKYEFVVERVSGGLSICDVDAEPFSGFTTICDASMERDVLQALAALLSSNQRIGLDWYDIITRSSPIMRFKTHTFTVVDSWVSDSLKWFEDLESKTDIQNVRMISIYGGVTLCEAGEIMTALADYAKNNRLLCSLVNSNTDTSVVRISLWLDSEMIGSNDY